MIQRSALQTAMRRLWRGTNGKVGAMLVAIISLVAIVAPVVDPYNPRKAIGNFAHSK